MATECLSHYIYWRPHHRVRCSYGPSWTTNFQWLLVVCRLGGTIIFEWRGKKGSLKIYQASSKPQNFVKISKNYWRSSPSKKQLNFHKKAWNSFCRSEQKMPKTGLQGSPWSFRLLLLDHSTLWCHEEEFQRWRLSFLQGVKGESTGYGVFLLCLFLFRSLKTRDSKSIHEGKDDLPTHHLTPETCSRSLPHLTSTSIGPTTIDDRKPKSRGTDFNSFLLQPKSPESIWC